MSGHAEKSENFMQGLLLKCKHLFFLHFFTNYCESQRTHTIIFCGSQAQISAKETRFAPKISSDIRSAAGELFIGPSQSLPEMSDGHWGTLISSCCWVQIYRRHGAESSLLNCKPVQEHSLRCLAIPNIYMIKTFDILQ